MKIRINKKYMLPYIYMLPSVILLLFVSGSASAQVSEAQIALKAANGQYVCAENGGGQEVVANRHTRREWEAFTLIRMPSHKIALMASNGQYLSAENGGGIVVANRDRIGPWETFNLISTGPGSVAFQAVNGQYVCAEGGGGRELVANRNKVGPWETFTLEVLRDFAAEARARQQEEARRAQEVRYWRHVRSVAYGDGTGRLGSFVKIDNQSWHEVGRNHEVRFAFEETGRDETSIHLYDRSRRVSIQLDLQNSRVMYSNPQNRIPVLLYSILGTR